MGNPNQDLIDAINEATEKLRAHAQSVVDGYGSDEGTFTPGDLDYNRTSIREELGKARKAIIEAADKAAARRAANG